MGRAKWKGSFISNRLLYKLNKNTVFIWSRRSVILNNFISKKFFVYTGKIFKPVFITREKVGFKYGEFSMTKKFQFLKKVNKKKIKKKK